MVEIKKSHTIVFPHLETHMTGSLFSFSCGKRIFQLDCRSNDHDISSTGLRHLTTVIEREACVRHNIVTVLVRRMGQAARVADYQLYH